MSRRAEKIGSAIRQEVSQVIMRELNDPRLDGLLPSITRVKVADDMSIADLYVIFMGTQGKQAAGLAALRHAAGMMRTKVAKALTTRTVPYLRFHLDEAYRKEMEVLDLIRRVEREHAADAEQGGGEATTPDGGATGEETEQEGR
jgi:ribosome-binding factor A